MGKVSRFNLRTRKEAVALLQSGKRHQEVIAMLPRDADRPLATVGMLNHWRRAILGAKVQIPLGRPTKRTQELTDRVMRDMRRHRDPRSCRSILNSVNKESKMPISNSTMYRVLKANQKIKCKKRIFRYVLNRQQIKARREWAERNQNTIWDYVTFTDEKRFRADGGFNRKSFYLESHGQPLKSKYMQHGFVVDCLMFISANNTCTLEILERRLHGVDYACYVRAHVPPYSMLLQDNGSSHLTAECREVFAMKNITLIKQPTYSCDLNPVENAWARLSHLTYEGGKEYDNRDALVAGILEAWQKMLDDHDWFLKLIASMRKRVAECSRLRGNKTRY